MFGTDLSKTETKQPIICQSEANAVISAAEKWHRIFLTTTLQTRKTGKHKYLEENNNHNCPNVVRR